MREKYFCEDKDTSSYVFYNDLHRPFVGVVERKDHRRGKRDPGPLKSFPHHYQPQ